MTSISQSKKGGKDQESIQSDPGYHMGKWHKTQLNITQQVTTRLQLTDAEAWNTWDINNTNDLQKKYRLGTVSKNILLEGLNRFHSTKTW